MATLTDALADSALASDSEKLQASTSVIEAGVASEVWTPDWTGLGQSFGDVAKASDAWTPGVTAFGAAWADQAQARDQLQVSRALAQTDTGTFTETWNVVFVPRLVERAKVSDAWSVQANYLKALSERAKASEAWTVIDTRGTDDSATAAEDWSPTYILNASLQESGFASDAFAPARQVNASLQERGFAADLFSTVMAYQVMVVERAYGSEVFAPSGEHTVWVVNTRTNAVTEYKNFPFNSVVSMGRKYVAADESGLYELNGSNDPNNTNVFATLKGGYTQLNGNKYAGLKGVYIAVSGQGPNAASGSWLLTLKTADGAEFVYKAQSNPGRMVSKINIGKGLRTAYLAWELSNADGQDFNFNNIELIPMMSGRRVG